jgi:arylsulfatase A-like enzyme
MPSPCLRRCVAYAFALAVLAALSACDGSSADKPAAPASPAPTPEAPRTPTHRNVIVYLVDTLRADHLSVYGYGRPTSPYLEQLAKTAAVFEDCSSQAPWTLPSVVSLFTSSFPVSHRVLSATQSVLPDAETMVEYFASLGYHTVGFVDNTLGGKGGGLDQGYAEFTERPPPDKDPSVLDTTHKTPINTVKGLMDWANTYDGKQDYFLYVHTVEPHDPYEGWAMGGKPAFFMGDGAERDRLNGLMKKAEKLHVSTALGTIKPEEAAEYASVQAELKQKHDECLQLYDGDVLRADQGIARLMNVLGKRPRWNETVVVVLADHGEELDDHGGWHHGHTLYQELVHVPLIVRVPGLTDAGARLTAPARLIDVLPTLAELAGGPPRDEWQGRSLAPALRGQTLSDAPIMSMKIEVDHPLGPPLGNEEMSFRSGSLKLISHLDFKTRSLYDLATDPHEQHDLIDERAKDASELVSRLQRAMHGVPQRPLAKDEGPLEGDKLQSIIQLGYIDGAGKH